MQIAIVVVSISRFDCIKFSRSKVSKGRSIDHIVVVLISEVDCVKFSRSYISSGH